jgi:hypothetical protein
MYIHGDQVKKELQKSGFLSGEASFRWNSTHNQEVLIKTADSPASIESAQSFLLGLYDSTPSQTPSTAKPKLNVRSFSDDLFTGFPGGLRNVHIVKSDQDTFDIVQMCPNVKAQLNQISKNNTILRAIE